MRSFTLRGLTLYLPEAALKGNLERALSSGRYENHEADALLMHVRPGDRLLDLGAGLGFICALAARVLGEGAVFGVEAGPETVKLARKNLVANGFPGVKLMRGAVVGEGEGEVEFGQRPAFWASALKGPDGWPENAEVIRVPARPIGKLLARVAPTVISCDIEGGSWGCCASRCRACAWWWSRRIHRSMGQRGWSGSPRLCMGRASRRQRARRKTRWSSFAFRCLAPAFGGVDRG